MTRTGLDRLLGDEQSELGGLRLGAVVHPASVTAGLEPTARGLLRHGFDLRKLFGPQHGARGEKQDNMIESGHFTDRMTGLPVLSLYGEVRKPTRAMLAGIEVLLFDLQDVGTRVYTFIWTMALAMEACGEAGVRFVVLDRPNPVGGELREGALLRAGFESFVGLHPIPLRHGLTCGEVARWLEGERGVACDLEVIRCAGLSRSHSWSDTGLPWVMPSPNLPTPESCAVYPGMVLFEGTNLSEGRGTTRPFELVGAPFVDGDRLADALRERDLSGTALRPCYFEPTFNKHAGALCGGVQIHVTDPDAFRPVRTAVELMAVLRALYPGNFEWRQPPYEYEQRHMPIDILWGSDDLRLGIEAGLGADRILASEEAEVSAFNQEIESYLLYR